MWLAYFSRLPLMQIFTSRRYPKAGRLITRKPSSRYTCIPTIYDAENSNSRGQAIDWAVENEVDIINMSFGSRFEVPGVREAIRRSANTTPKETILFAAASNSGINSERTFPATDSRVIAVHALDGKGNDLGGLNPSREGYYPNFGTLGLGIPTLWDGRVEYKSGTSYAAPIAAGIAANCIEWLDYMQDTGLLTPDQYASLRRPEGIRYMFAKQAKKIGDLLSVAPWNLWKENPLDPVRDGETARPVDPQADARVLGVLTNELQPVKPERPGET